jgi:hypothetical protein
MKVIYSPEALLYLEDLAHKLYLNHYFGFKESAKEYVDELSIDIENTLPYRPHTDAPSYFDQFGEDMSYAVFRKNKRTHWYAFFDTYLDDNEETVYVVRHISNNHTVAQYL